jgi:hypothetical protein
MTLAIAWVRKISDKCEELVVAADSRLSGGFRLDCCPKILTLPRSDSFICFAGETDYAYPLMLQLALAIEAYPLSRDRAMDIHNMRGHTLKVFNSMCSSVHSYVEGMEIPDASFILGGYSWIRKTFSIWKIHYKQKEKQFVYRPAKKWIGNFEKIVFAGDWAKVARDRLVGLLRERHSLTADGSTADGFDMEPFEVLRDILRESKPTDSVGGSPQIVKVYQHMNCRPLGVYWPNRESQSVFLLGRPLLDYENCEYWVLDPDTLKTSHSYFSKPRDD